MEAFEHSVHGAAPQPTARTARPQLGPDALAAGIGIAYCVALWWPARDLPYHWDGAMYVARGARDLIERGFSPLVVTTGDFSHPPLYVALLAACWTLFGTDRVIAHALVLPFLPLLLASTYAIGKRWHDRAVGGAACALLALSPVVVSEYGQIYFDLPLAALLTAGLSLWLADRRAAAGVLLSLGAAIKLPALIFPGSLLVLGLLRRERPRALWPLLLPFAVIASWLVYHHAHQGFWLSRPGRSSHLAGGPLELARNVGLVIQHLLRQGRWLPAALAALAGLGLLVRKLRASGRPAVPAWSLTLAFVLCGGIGFFAITGEFAQRYGIMLLPPLFLLSAAALHAALARRPLAYAVVIALCAAFSVGNWFPQQTAASPRAALRPDEDLAYLDMIALGRELGALLQREYPNARVYGGDVERYWLAEPFQGYVTRAFDVRRCREFRSGPASAPVLIVAHLYSREARYCFGLVQRTQARPVARLAHGGKWLEVHAVP